jgi:hypothetical protein
MESDPNYSEVISLLKKLKDSNGAYPSEMLALRRQGYIRQVAEISVGVGPAFRLRNIARGGQGAAGLSSTAGTLVEALLVVALVAEAGAVTFFYRSKLAEFFRSVTNSPNVQEVSSPPVLISPIPKMALTPSPALTLTGTGTLTLTPGSTPSLELASETARPDGGSSISGQPASTNAPKGNPGSLSVSTKAPKGNNGNHYGQTPKPERTKEPGKNNGPTQESNKKSTKSP